MEEVGIDIIVKTISNVGFPIVVVIWMMFKADKYAKVLTERLAEIREEIIKLAGEIRRGNGK